MTTVSVIPRQASALHEILQWSASRPDWQRDALRRIVQKGDLDTTDIDELERIAGSKLQNLASRPVPLAAQPLAAAHLPSASGVSESVSLLSLSSLKGVNRLPDGSDLPFGTGRGLSIIYGGNGAGKSSYARVIKRACRARGTCQPITPNAFAAKPSNDPASATINFQYGNLSVQTKWVNGTPADPRLANVFVFDANCAEHYVSYDSEAAFTPFGLDILPKLSKACDQLALRLKITTDQWKSQITSASANWRFDPATKAGTLIHNLGSATKASDVTALATLGTTELNRIATLRDALKADPLKKAEQTRAAKARVDAFLQLIRTASVILSDTAVLEVEKELTEAIESADAAKAFASRQFDATFLKGTGSDLWRKLWEAAREYSTNYPYPLQDFPPVSVDARCVLCQQELDSSARGRFTKFDALCRDKSQAISAEAERTLISTKSKYALNGEGLKAGAEHTLAPGATGNPPSSTYLRTELGKIEADLSVITAAKIAHIAEFVTKSDERLRQIGQNLVARKWSTIPNLPASPESFLQEAATALQHKAETEEAANDPIARRFLDNELKELEAREWLSRVQAEVLNQIEWYRIVGELEGCKKDLNTAAITTKSSELTETFVTTAYRQRFQEEAGKLGLTTLDVVVDAIQGKKGVTHFGLRLSKAANGKVAEIASEGEHRCVALAAFLADLSQSPHQSALVFDDPVSSLDHWHRQKIAERLVEEARNRQVIVFTHEATFLNDLLFFEDEAKQVPYVLTVEWCNSAPGKYQTGLPWDIKKPHECLAVLDQDQLAISNQWNLLPNAANIAAMRGAYSRLRSVMERIVETELLKGIVERFQSQVVSGRVKYLVGITAQECDEAKRLLQKCHDLTSSHAPSSKAIPTPNDLKQDIADARGLIGTIRARHKAIK